MQILTVQREKTMSDSRSLWRLDRDQLTGVGSPNNDFWIKTKEEQWKKWGRGLKTSRVGGAGGWIKVLHSHLQPTHISPSPAEPQQWPELHLSNLQKYKFIMVQVIWSAPQGGSLWGQGFVEGHRDSVLLAISGSLGMNVRTSCNCPLLLRYHLSCSLVIATNAMMG